MILNKETLSYYIGSASTDRINSRFSKHLIYLNGSKIVKNSVNKYGLHNFATAANVGTYSNIVISVTDGTASASLAAFAVAVTQVGTGSVTLSWMPPTENTDGSTLTNLSGYHIYYGTSANALTQSIDLNNVGITTYVIPNLSSGTTYYFALKAYTANGLDSDMSNVASKSIT